MIVADSIASLPRSSTRTRWGVKPSECHRLPHVQRTWATRRFMGPTQPLTCLGQRFRPFPRSINLCPHESRRPSFGCRFSSGTFMPDVEAV